MDTRRPKPLAAPNPRLPIQPRLPDEHQENRASLDLTERILARARLANRRRNDPSWPHIPRAR